MQEDIIELGWELINYETTETYYAFKRGNEYLGIDLDKRKIEYHSKDGCELSFATLEAIRELIIYNAIH